MSRSIACLADGNVHALIKLDTELYAGSWSRRALDEYAPRKVRVSLSLSARLSLSFLASLATPILDEISLHF
jgi:hypothetical protein